MTQWILPLVFKTVNDVKEEGHRKSLGCVYDFHIFCDWIAFEHFNLENDVEKKQSFARILLLPSVLCAVQKEVGQKKEKRK